ncbi:MAG: Asp23/Gls24 family envelope stress response protein [Faecousia sp.]
MADNKQYVAQNQENGCVMISEDVISTIVAHAVKDVEGVVGLSNKSGLDIVDIIAKKSWGKGINVTISADDTVSVDCDIIVSYGQSVVSVAAALQEAIVSALESMTGVRVGDVNVNVCGIVRQ